MASTSAASEPQESPGLRLRAGVDALLGQLSNFWFGMSLLAVWGVMTLIGVLVDQGKDASFYQINYAPALARLVLRLHLDNIYHSPAYIAIIALIVACMTLATFWRVIPARLPPLRGVKIAAMPLNATVQIPGDEASVRARVEAFFAERGWLVRKREQNGVEWTFADKNNWARKGVLVAHVGFVLIAAGTTLYWALGYSGQTAILAGSTVTIPENGTRLQLERFRFRIDPIQTKGGIIYQPIDYVSNLRVASKDGSWQNRVLRVNDPLDVAGTLYYQASYGFAVPFTLTKDGRALPNVPSTPLKEGEGFAVGDTSRSVQYARFVGTIGPDNTIGADPRPNNPGVVLNVYDGAQRIGAVLVPLERGLNLGDGYHVEPGSYVMYSGIEYRHDPGIPLVGIGAFVLLAGLCICFYLVPARLFVRLDAASGRSGSQTWSVGIAATTVKGYEIFEEQFYALVEALGAAGAAEPAADSATSLPATASRGAS